MELLTKHTSAYLLQASLDVLHYESHEWQEEVTFVQDEVKFLHKLHRNFSEKMMPEVQRQHATKLQEELKGFSARVLNLQETIREHEQYLVEMIQPQINVSDEEYRTAHKKVKLQTESLLEELKQLKKEIFQWTEDIMS